MYMPGQGRRVLSIVRNGGGRRGVRTRGGGYRGIGGVKNRWRGRRRILCRLREDVVQLLLRLRETCEVKGRRMMMSMSINLVSLHLK